MAGTIIDSLVVMLGLDTKELEAKTPAATQAMEKIEKSADRADKNVGKVSKTAKEGSQNVSTLTRSLTALLSVIGGTMAVKAFVNDFIATNAQLDRFSKNIGLNVSTISAWSNASELLGGSAQGLQGTLDMLSKSQTQLMLTGESSLIPYMSALGISLADVTGKARPVTDILLDLSERFSKMDRTTANNMGRMMGLDQGTMNLLLQGRKELELEINRQRQQSAVTKEQAAEASKLQKAIIGVQQTFAVLGRSLVMEAAPALEKVLTWFQNLATWAQQNKEFITDFFEILAAGLAAVALAASPITLTAVAIAGLAAGIALLYQDYQTWKRGGDSFIDWSKWEPAITAATKGIHLLAGALETAWGWYSKFHDSPMMDKLREKLGVDKFFGVDKPPATNPNRKPVVTQTDNQASSAAMQKYFISQGWTPAQAAGISANLISESNGRANAIGDRGSAYGIGQWHKDRQNAFRKWSGHSIQGTTVQEQMAFVQYELTQGNEKAAGAELKKATTAQQAGEITSRKYERPSYKKEDAEQRGSLAEKFEQGYAQSIQGIPGASRVAAIAPGGSQGQPANVDKSTQLSIDTINVHTQATDAPGIANDMWKALDYTLASQANYGMVP